MLDQTALSAYFGNDATMLRRFIGLFVREAPSLVNQVDEAIHSGDWPSVAVGAHTLKSQLKYFGFPEEVAQLQQIENLAEGREGLNRLPLLWAEFSGRLGQVYEHISKL